MTSNKEIKYGGKVFFLDRSDINTDEIIPAKYLTHIEREPLKPLLLEDLKIDGLDPKSVKWDDYQVVVSRANFGCGSSREMAVWAFRVNGISTVIAQNFARIFRENAFNDGMLAIELNEAKINEIFEKFSKKKDVTADIDLNKMNITLKSEGISETYQFELNPFQKEVIQHGGLVHFMNKKF